MTPSRAATVAAQIAFQIREHEAYEAEWVKKRDDVERARADKPATHPLVLVLDNLRSGENVGSLIRTAEAAGIEEVI